MPEPRAATAGPSDYGSEGDAPVEDPIGNEVYDNLEVVYRFIKDVFGKESVDNLGKTLVASVHYRQKYLNGSGTVSRWFMATATV